MRDPILIASLPRSGSSLVSSIIDRAGVFSGNIKAGDEWNEYGYFENINITNLLVQYLRKHDVDKKGKRFQPVGLDEPYIHFHNDVSNVMYIEGLRTNEKWYYKDPKIALTWKLWNTHFPKAKWVIVERDLNEVMSSIKRTKFMDAFSTREEWASYIGFFLMNIDSIKRHCNYITINVNELFEQRFRSIDLMCDFIGVPFNEDILSVINKRFWNGNNTE